jgi:hypothetical protein
MAGPAQNGQICIGDHSQARYRARLTSSRATAVATPRPWRAGATAWPSSAAPFNGGFPSSVADRCSVVAEEQVQVPLTWFVPLRGGR